MTINWKIDFDYQNFFNINSYYSFGDLINFFIATGGRGIGKTTSTIKHFFQDAVNNGEEFVIVRRYKDEIGLCKDIFSPLVDGVTIRPLKKGIFEYHYNKKRIGYGVALSLQQNFKSGVDFSKVTNILYDEAIIMRGGTVRYLKEEITFFFELISTIVRLRTNYKVFIFGNNLDLFNPYYEYFNIPLIKGRYIDKKRKLIVEELPTKAGLKAIEEETPLYALTKGTTYGDYHYENKVLTSSNVGVLGEKPDNAKLVCRLVYHTVTLNVYLHYQGIYVECKEKIIKDNLTFTIVENGSPNYDDVKLYRGTDIKGAISRCYYRQKATYDSQKTYTILGEIVELIK